MTNTQIPNTKQAPITKFQSSDKYRFGIWNLKFGYSLVFVIWLLVIIVGSEAAAMEPTSGYPAIQRAFLREDFNETAALAQAFIAQRPDVPEASRVRLWLALSLERLQRTEEALQELDLLERALSPGDPLISEALFWDGEVSRRAFQMTRAKDAYLRLLEHHPSSIWTAQAQLGLGFVALHQRAFELAAGYFHEVVLRHPDTATASDARLFEGFADLELGRFDSAVRILEPLLAELQDPGVVARAAFYLGESVSGLKRYAEAIPVYQRAIDSAARSQWGQLAQFGLGWACYQESRCEESVSAFDRYLAQATEHRTEALYAQGGCLIKLGREPEALSRFEQIVSRAPSHPLALESGMIIADAYRRTGRPILAKEMLHALLRWPLDGAARANVQLRLGTLALEQGNTAQAETVFGLAAKREEPAIRQAALNGLGDVQSYLGNPAAAEQSYRAAAAISAVGPQSGYAAFQLGRIRLQSGLLEEAAAIFQQLAAGPEASLAEDARFALIITHLNRHDEASARAILDAIRHRQPSSAAAARAAYYDALLALSAEDEDAARRFCGETMARAPFTDEALEARLLMAELRARREPAAEVMAWLGRAYEASGAARSHRARLAKRLGDFARSAQSYADAIRWYQVAMELLPSLEGEAGYRIASCYEEGGDGEMAMRWYQPIGPPPWRVRGQLALAKLLERADRIVDAQAVYALLANEPIPEAKMVRERLAAMKSSEQVSE